MAMQMRDLAKLRETAAELRGSLATMTDQWEGCAALPARLGEFGADDRVSAPGPQNGTHK